MGRTRKAKVFAISPTPFFPGSNYLLSDIESHADNDPTLLIIGHCESDPPITKLDTFPESGKPLVGLPEIPDHFTSVPRPHEIRPSPPPLFDKYVRPIPKITFTARVLARLVKLEAREPLVSFRDDYRLAWLTVFYANDRSRHWIDGFGPWEFSFCSMFGKHPKKVIPELVARAAKHAAMDRPAFPPKKPAMGDKADRRKGVA